MHKSNGKIQLKVRENEKISDPVKFISLKIIYLNIKIMAG